MKKIFTVVFSSILLFMPSLSLAWMPFEQDLGQIVITSTRIGQSDHKISSNVTVITQEQIASSGAQTIPDILKEAVGVFVYDKNTSKTASLDIRGFGDTATRNILVLINDRKINLMDMSAPDLTQLPLSAVERIEIVRGAGTVLYGDNAVGGVVNIITKQGKGPMSGRWGAFSGSYNTRGTDTELSGAHEDLSYYFYSKYFDERGYREHSDVLSKDMNTRLGYKISDKIKISFNAGVHQDKAELPGGLDEAELSTLGRRGSANQDDIADTKDKYYQLSLDATPWPEDIYYGNFVVDLHYRDRHVFDSFWGTFNTDRDINTKGITAKYIFNKPIFDKEVNFVTGIDCYDAENKILGSGTNSDDIVISKTEWGTYGFLQYELFDRFFVNGGTRYHKAAYTFNDIGSVSFIEKDPSVWSSMGGVKYEYAKGSALHASFQETFRFLTTDEWYTWSGLNTGLKQQTGKQYEIGIKHNFDDFLLAHITPYWIDNTNEIFYDPTAGGGWGANSNYDRTRRVGIETGADMDVLKFMDIEAFDKLKFFMNYTYQNAEFNGGVNNGKNIPMVPNYQVNGGLVVGFFKNYQVSLNGRYVGSRYILNDTLNEMPQAKPYCVIDTKLSYNQGFMEVYFGINNLFNEMYSPYQAKKTITTRDYFPAPERNYVFGMNMKF